MDAKALLNFPVNITCEVLVNWVDGSAVARLDSALCNHDLRRSYMTMLASPQFSFEVVPVIRVDRLNPFLAWLVSRSARLWEVTAYATTDSDLLRSLLERQSGSFTGSIFLHNQQSTSPIYSIVAENCNALTTLEFHHCHGNAGVGAMLQANGRTWKDIRLVECSRLEASFMPGMHCPCLHTLDLRGSTCTEPTLEAAAAACPALRRLVLDNCVGLTSASVVKAVQCTPHLKVLGLRALLMLDDASVAQIVAACTCLTVIDVSYCSKITDAAIIALARSCSKLSRLYMHHNSNFSDASLQALAEKRANTLTCLNIRNCRGLTSEGIRQTLTACSKVLTFQFSGSGSDGLSPRGLMSIVRCCGHVINKLSVLNDVVPDEVLIAIAQHCPRVKHLTLQNALGYTATGLMAIVRQCASLRTIVVHPAMSGVVNPFSVQLWQFVRPQLVVSTDEELHKYFLLQDCDL